MPAMNSSKGKMRRRSISDDSSHIASPQPRAFNFLLLLKTRRQARRVQEQSAAIEVVKGHLHDIGTDLKIHRGKVNPFEIRKELEAGGIELPWLIFHPYSTWRLGWDVLIMILLLYSLLAVPLRIAFENIDCSNNFYDQSLFWYIDLGLDCCFVMDVLISFRTAYMDVSDNAEARIVTTQYEIAKNYAKGFLLFDIISSVPFDLILLMVSCDTVHGANRILRSPKALKIIRLVRLLRLLRISRLQVFLRKINDMLQINPGLLRLLYFIFLVCLAFHYNSCIFFFIGEFYALDENGEEQGSWTLESKLISAFVGGSEDLHRISDLEGWQQYFVCLYWTVTTMTTVGWGDLTPKTVPEVTFTLLVLLQGGATFSYMVGNMATLISRISPRTIKYRARQEIWENFFHRENISHEMRRRIRNYENYMYREPLGNMPTFARRELSGSLLREITGHIYSKALHSLKIFKGLDEYCLTHLALALKPVQLPPGEVIYKEGDYGNCMFFLHTGEVEFSMLLMADAEKAKLGIKNVGDTAFTDSFITRNQKKQNQQPEEDSGGAKRAFRFTRIATGWRMLGNRKVQCQNFSWRMNSDNKHTCFGESVLTSTTGVRLSTATTTTWTVLFLLDRDKLREVVNRIPAMKVVWANIKKHRTSRLVRAVSRVVQSMRTRYNDTGRLYVEVQKGVNLPRTDGFLGKCDGFCTLQREGEGVEDKRVYHTRVQYSTFSPVWDETFLFPVQEGRGGADVNIKIALYDHNMIGQHEFIGFAMLDATELCEDAFDHDDMRSESRWLYVKKVSSNGVSMSVKGGTGKGKEKFTKIKVGLRAVPPPKNPDDPDAPPRRRSPSGRASFEGKKQDAELAARGSDGSLVREEEAEEGRREGRSPARGVRFADGDDKDGLVRSDEHKTRDAEDSGERSKRVLFETVLDVLEDASPRPSASTPLDFGLDLSRTASNVSTGSVDSDQLVSTKGLRSNTQAMLMHGPNGTDSGLLLLCGVSEHTGGSLFAFDKPAQNVPLHDDFGDEWWKRVIPPGSGEDGADGVYKSVLEAVLRSQHGERAEVDRELQAMAHRLHEMEDLVRRVARQQRLAKTRPARVLVDSEEEDDTTPAGDPDPDPDPDPALAVGVETAPARQKAQVSALPKVAHRSGEGHVPPKKLAPLLPLPPKVRASKERSRRAKQGSNGTASPLLGSAGLNGGGGGVPRDSLSGRDRSPKATPRSRYQPPPGHQRD